jgi:uncharacterized membrane protein YgdD (TMEM256/DUF423 family)
VERTFLILGALFGFIGVALGAFGSHVIRSRLPPERVATFETGVRYQLWHALALIAVVFVGSLRFSPRSSGPSHEFTLLEGSIQWPAWVAGLLFVAGIVLFSGSLYALALSGRRAWGIVTPLGGACLLLGWLALILEAWVA